VKRFKIGSVIGMMALTALGSPAGVAQANAPQAHASKKCRSVTTKNGGRSTFINISGTIGCRRARRVAARANGNIYTALEFKCKPSGKPSRFGLLYGCSGNVNGKPQGIGFYYKKG